MSLVVNPYSYFTDTNGNALNGYLYVGEVGKNAENYPIAIFYDNLFTTPAPNPLTVSAGYIYNGGTIAQIYASVDYSIVVKKTDGSLIYSSLNETGMTNGAIANIDEMKDFVAPYNNYALNVLGNITEGDGEGGAFYYDANSTATADDINIIEPTSGSGRWIRVIPLYTQAYTIETVDDFDSIPSGYITAIVKDIDRGGIFIWESSGTANGGTVFAGSSGYWVRQYSGAVNVKWFGAKGDGVTDDTEAIQYAIDASIQALNNGVAKSVFIPAGKYLITTPLNLTADDGTINRRDIKLFGENTGSGDYIYGTQLVGATAGKAIIEIIDNDNFKLKDITLVDSAINPSSVGIYQARRTGGTSPSQWAGNCHYENVTISFSDDDITKNNNFGTIGIINVAGEETTYDRCEVWANLPFVLSWSNTFRKAVDALTANTYDSFEYNPVHATQADISDGDSNTIYRTNNCRFISKGFNAPSVLLHEVGSYFANGDFTQTRNAITGTDGDSSIGYECWGVWQLVINSACENTQTPILIHRGVYNCDINLRGSESALGADKGLIHFGIDAPSFVFANNKIKIDYPSGSANGFITYTKPSGVGSLDPAVITLRNSDLYVNDSFADATIDKKILYKSQNVTYNFNDFELLMKDRYMKFPIFSKSIGTPATTTDLINMVFPTAIANLSNFSATVIGHFHVSNGEGEGAGSASSAFIKAMWQFTRNQTPTNVLFSKQTLNQINADVNTGGNSITDLTLSHTLTGTSSVVLKVASVQSGVNNAAAWISGYVEVIYAGGYSEAPIISLL